MNRKAFTLVELLVVIAIISLLISILAPSLQVAKDIAKQTLCASDMNSAGRGIYLYCQMHNDKYPPYLSKTVNKKLAFDPYPKVENMMWVAKEGHLNSATLKQIFRGIGSMYDSGFIESPHFFYCPAQKHPWFDYQEYATDRNTGQTVPWGTMDNHTNWVRIGLLHNAWGKWYANEGQNGQYDIAFRTLSAMEQDKALLIDHALFPWCAAVHTATGVDSPTFNILYPDGHVEGRKSTLAIEIMIAGASVSMNSPGDIVKSWDQWPDNLQDWHSLYTVINEGL